MESWCMMHDVSKIIRTSPVDSFLLRASVRYQRLGRYKSPKDNLGQPHILHQSFEWIDLQTDAPIRGTRCDWLDPTTLSNVRPDTEVKEGRGWVFGKLWDEISEKWDKKKKSETTDFCKNLTTLEKSVRKTKTIINNSKKLEAWDTSKIGKIQEK